jgi:hypothetical protein
MVPSSGMNTVASPRSCWNKSLAYTPPLAPVWLRPCAWTVACNSPRVPFPPGEDVLSIHEVLNANGQGGPSGARPTSPLPGAAGDCAGSRPPHGAAPVQLPVGRGARDQRVARQQIGCRRHGLTSARGISRSLSRQMTCAAGIWSGE